MRGEEDIFLFPILHWAGPIVQRQLDRWLPSQGFPFAPVSVKGVFSLKVNHHVPAHPGFLEPYSGGAKNWTVGFLASVLAGVNHDVIVMFTIQHSLRFHKISRSPLLVLHDLTFEFVNVMWHGKDSKGFLNISKWNALIQGTFWTKVDHFWWTNSDNFVAFK